MEIKQKHRKHALRKAVTAAVLAGTAFSSLGGFTGAVTTVKADDTISKEISTLIGLIADKNLGSNYGLGKTPEKVLKEIKEYLSTLSVETLTKLINGFDDGRYDYPNNTLSTLSGFLGTFNSENEYLRRAISLRGLLVDEITDRINKKRELEEDISEKEIELKNKEEEILSTLRKIRHIESELDEKNTEISNKEQELNDKEAELKDNKEELMDALNDLYNAEGTIEEKEAKVKDLSEKLDASRKEHEALAKEFAESQKGYEKELADKHNALGEAEKQNQDLTNENKELKENLGTAEEITNDLQKKVMNAEKAMKEIEAELKAEKESLEAEKAKLAEAKEANEKLSEERDAAKKEAEKVPELEEQVEKLVEEITAAKKEAEDLQAKSEGLEKDFEAVKAEKEVLEAEIAKLKEDHQKEVDALNALLTDKEKMLKNLQDQLDKAKEEAMKNEQMSQEEKAKLQAELDKAKQELAEKIKDMPNKVAPQAEGKANAGQAAPNQNQNQNQNNQAQANQAKNANNLPSTGDKPVNPLLVASGLSLMIGAGAFVYAGKRKKG